MNRIEETIGKIESLDRTAMESARARQDTLTKPLGSLGVLEDLSVKIAGITGNYMPLINDKVIITMAGDHGIVDEGVSAYPRDVTSQMVYNFLSGGAGINVLARHAGGRVVVVDMGVAADIELAQEHAGGFIGKKIAYGTANITKGAAMSYDDAKRSIEAGIEILESEIEKGMDIVGVGDMGIGNTTPSSAIVAFITGEPVEFVTGRGTGLDDEGLKKKVKAIKKALAVNKPNRGAAALIAYEVSPKIRDYLIASHLSVESGHRAILDHLGLEPLFNLNMRLGEGTGAALGISIVEASCKILQEMSTFEEAGVSEKASG